MATAQLMTLNAPPALKGVRLTGREIEVLGLIAAGHRSREAADRLFLSKRTVDYHLSNVFGKLRVGNRMQAVRAAQRLGMLPSEPPVR